MRHARCYEHSPAVVGRIAVLAGSSKQSNWLEHGDSVASVPQLVETLNTLR
ncbi:MAG: hypothetical protein ACI9NC_002034 [Verrucomicrobiales bacterium]|jgi:hypothetical protein